ncbi:MAG: SpoIIE family protein phosphatase [Anaerolineae bacterium]|nr:SpoIIE family protein phosphatase [Anaerolineae bacterium]
MILVAEFHITAINDNLIALGYYLQGIGHRLQLTEDSFNQLESAVMEAAAAVVEGAYPPGRVGELVIRVELPETATDRLYIMLTHMGQSIPPPDALTYSSFVHVEVVAPTIWRLTMRIERSGTTLPLSEAEQDLNAIQTISEVLTTQIHLDDLLRMIIDRLVETIDADRGTLYLIDPDTGDLFSKILLEDASVLREVRVKMGQGIAGYVAQTGEIVNVNDAYTDPRFLRSYDVETGYLTRNVLAVPMRNPKQQIIGVVQLLNKHDGNFTRRDERMLVAMASQAAIGVENARLYADELQQQLFQQQLETAKAIQRSFLPVEVPQFGGWDVAVAWEPAYNVSGDFYIIHPLGYSRTALVIADVCGKSIPAALFMALSVTVLRFIMQLEFSPVQLLHHANHVINSYNEQSKMFASIFVAYLDFATGEMHYASGGHNPPLLYRSATDTFIELKARGILVGLFEEVEFEQEVIRLQEGDTLVMYTDGVTEAMNIVDEEFGMQRLETVIRENATCSAAELRDHILSAVDAFAGERGRFDDETLVIVRRA